MMPSSLGSKASIEPERDRGCHVDPQDLQRAGSEARSEHDRDENDEAFADVGRQRPDDELREVVEYSAAFFDGGFDGGEVVVGEDHVGGFLGDLGTPLPHRDADVCLLQRGRVVDAVARHRDDVAASPAVLRPGAASAPGDTRAKTDARSTVSGYSEASSWRDRRR